MTLNTDHSTGDYFSAAYRDYEKQNPDRKLDHYLAIITSRITDPAPKVLDAGCGLGAFLARTAHRQPAWTLFAADVDESAVEATRKRVPMADVRLGSLDALTFDTSFDVVTAWDVLEHVPDLDGARRAIRSLLRPGGLLVFVVPVYDGLTGPAIRLLDRDPTHLHRKPRSFWIEWAEDGFRDVHWHGIYRYLLAGRFYAHVPTRGLRNHTPAIAVTALR